MTIKMPYGEECLPDLKASFLMFVFVVIYVLTYIQIYISVLCITHTWLDCQV